MVRALFCILVSIFSLSQFTGCGGGGGGYTVDSLPPAPPAPVIPPPPPAPVLSSPAILNNQIFLGVPEGQLRAYDFNSNLVWSYPSGTNLSQSVNTSPAVSNDGSVYFGADNGILYALSNAGVLKWEFKTGGEIRSSPGIDPSGNIYIGSKDGIIYSLDSSGNLRWSSDTGAAISASPAIYGPSAVAINNENGLVRSYNLNGSLRFEYQHANQVSSSPSFDFQGNLHYLDANGQAFSLDSTGALRFSKFIGNEGVSNVLIKGNGSLLYTHKDATLSFAGETLQPDGKYNVSVANNLNVGGEIRSTPLLGTNTEAIVPNLKGEFLSSNIENIPLSRLKNTLHVESSPLLIPGTGLYLGIPGSELFKTSDQGLLPATSAPWYRFRANNLNNGRVDCTPASNVLQNFTRFGKSNWSPDQNGQLQSQDNQSFSGILSDVAKESYSLGATLLSTNGDNDSIMLVVAAYRDGQNNLHAINAVRSGAQSGAALGGFTWALVYARLDHNDNFVQQSVIINSQAALGSPQGPWRDFPAGTRVEVTRDKNNISLKASKFSNGNQLLGVEPAAQIDFDLSSNGLTNQFLGPMKFGLAAHSQPLASFKDVNLAESSVCSY